MVVPGGMRFFMSEVPLNGAFINVQGCWRFMKMFRGVVPAPGRNTSMCRAHGPFQTFRVHSNVYGWFRSLFFLSTCAWKISLQARVAHYELIHKSRVSSIVEGLFRRYGLFKRLWLIQTSSEFLYLLLKDVLPGAHGLSGLEISGFGFRDFGFRA